ncbi:MAG: 5-formyltetrahydrofolate cyclo-ligase [Pseudomonadota bacterium]
MNERPDKKLLRHHMRQIREEAAARDPGAGESLADVFPMKLLERYGPVVSGYVKLNDEIDPAPLLKKLAQGGGELALPRVDPDGLISFRAWSHGEPLERGAFGLAEPAAEAPRVTPTLVLVPALAIDAKGVRLGYGKGHYDRALARLRAEGRAFACALVYQAQIIDAVPSEPHDQQMDWAVSERGSTPLFMMNALKQAAS